MIIFNDKGQFSLFALVAVLLGSILVGAVVLNQTVSDSNETHTPALPDEFVEIDKLKIKMQEGF